MKYRPGSGFAFVLGASLWTAAILAGFYRLMEYGATPGERVSSAAHWPAGSQLVPHSGRANLVMFLHPRCSCSGASVDELAELMARSAESIAAQVLVFKPGNVSANWERTELWDAAAIPGVQVFADEEGTRARQFGASTSGHTFLFDRDGRLLFSGGLTRARGQTGDSVGCSSILALLTSGERYQAETPVFGCALCNSPPRNG